MKKLSNILKFGFFSLNLINAKTQQQPATPAPSELVLDNIIAKFRKGNKENGIISSDLKQIQLLLNTLNLQNPEVCVEINGENFTVKLSSDITTEEQFKAFKKKLHENLDTEITRTKEEPNKSFPIGILNFKQYLVEKDKNMYYRINKKKTGLSIAGLIAILSTFGFVVTKLTGNKNPVPSMEI